MGAATRIIPDAVMARVLPPSRSFDPRQRAPLPLFREGEAHRLLIGPENSAGQGTRWARAIEEYGDRVGAQSLSVQREGGFDHDVDLSIPGPVFAWSRRWQRDLRSIAAEQVTHALVESGRPVLAGGSRGDLRRDLRWFGKHGVRAALAWHGSDVRDPERHAQEHLLSPYRDREWADAPGVASRASRNRRLMETSGLPSFVSTPDLLVDAPGATWLPVVVDGSLWRSHGRAFDHGGPPRVMHAPSQSVVKGSALIEPVLHEMHDRGIIRYRRVDRASHREILRQVAQADVVLDQFRLGSYGVAAVEAMAAGRLVIGDVSDAVRDIVRRRSGASLPIVNSTPAELRSVLEGIARNIDAAREIAASGPHFAREAHDGRMAAAALGRWIAGTTSRGAGE